MHHECIMEYCVIIFNPIRDIGHMFNNQKEYLKQSLKLAIVSQKKNPI